MLDEGRLRRSWQQIDRPSAKLWSQRNPSGQSPTLDGLQNVYSPESINGSALNGQTSRSPTLVPRMRGVGDTLSSTSDTVVILSLPNPKMRNMVDARSPSDADAIACSVPYGIDLRFVSIHCFS